FVFLLRVAPKVVFVAPDKNISDLLGRGVDHFEAESGKMTATFDTIVEKLYASFKSIQARMQEVSQGVEMLAYGMQQVTADQSNLFNLNAAIESACPRQDGFSVVAGEINELAERTRQLTGGVNDVTNHVREAVEQVAIEFGRVLDLIESMQTLMLNMDMHVQFVRKETDKGISIAMGIPQAQKTL
ncbi:MAG: methyl-accepting chemotaxis protein, partial [Azoarcus sp.]|nr:methyl-accepting chemotaxis protein [Azoarcus sp.]